MTKKTLAFVVYPGISLLELVGNCSVLGLIMGLGPMMKWKAGYEPVVVGERIEAIPTDTPLAIIPQKTFADVPQPHALVMIGGGADTLPALEHAELLAYVRRAGESARRVAAGCRRSARRTLGHDPLGVCRLLGGPRCPLSTRSVH